MALVSRLYRPTPTAYWEELRPIERQIGDAVGFQVWEAMEEDL